MVPELGFLIAMGMMGLLPRETNWKSLTTRDHEATITIITSRVGGAAKGA